MSINVAQREILRVERMYCNDDDRPLLSNIRINVLEAEIVGLCGASNSGKRTLAEIICGERQSYSGRMLLQEMRYAPKSIADARMSGFFIFRSAYRSSIVSLP